MDEIFVIIKCGYEGIDGLIFASVKTDDTINKLKDLRQNILDAKLRYKLLVKENGLKNDDDDDDFDDNIDKLLKDDKLSFEDWQLITTNPDRYCIQKWDGTNFKCFCDELKMNPSENWLMC